VLLFSLPLFVLYCFIEPSANPAMSRLFSKNKQQEINLLPEREFAGTVTGRILSWIISTFRVIVIATEILVMTAFLSRFWLDAQNTDLNEAIEEKKAIILAQSDFEHEFKDAQKRIDIYSQLSSRKTFSSYVTTISNQLPPDVSFTSLQESPGEIEITGQTVSEKSTQQLVVNLQSTGLFEDVLLTDIKTSQFDPGTITFTIKTILKGGNS